MNKAMKLFKKFKKYKIEDLYVYIVYRHVSKQGYRGEGFQPLSVVVTKGYVSPFSENPLVEIGTNYKYFEDVENAIVISFYNRFSFLLEIENKDVKKMTYRKICRVIEKMKNKENVPFVFDKASLKTMTRLGIDVNKYGRVKINE